MPIGFRLSNTTPFRMRSRRAALAPQNVERTVLCGGHQPRGGILRHTAEFPHLKRTAEGVLHDVFCQCEVMDSKDARQRGDQAPGFAPKQMIVRI